jgi:excisionase family DNA binding protein
MNVQLKAEDVKTLSVPQAGRRYFDLSRGASYAAAARGELPVVRIGRKIRVPIAALERMLERAGDRASAEQRR